jgi:hypothetical protein
MAYRVVYCQGSFALAAACDSREQAISRARSLCAKAGVWHVQVEDSQGRTVVRGFELQLHGRLPTKSVTPAHVHHSQPAANQFEACSEQR